MRPTARLIPTLCLLTATLGPTVARCAEAQEYIVASTRAARIYGEEDRPPTRPAVQLRKRADHAVLRFAVVDDTRQAETRRAELEAAIANLEQAAARSEAVDLALVATTPDGLELVRPFDRARAIASIEEGDRADTSEVRLLAKTAVREGDRELADPAARIHGFLAGVHLAGRATIEPTGAPVLSLVQPEQYRPAVITAIAADLRMIRAALGPEYGGRLEGLEQPIAWVQLDELELGLYLPYRLTIQPSEG